MSISRVSPEVIKRYEAYKELLPTRTQFITNLVSHSRKIDIALVILGLLSTILAVYSFSQHFKIDQRKAPVKYLVSLFGAKISGAGSIIMIGLSIPNLYNERWLKNNQNVQTLFTEWKGCVAEKKQRYEQFVTLAKQTKSNQYSVLNREKS